MPSIEQDRSWTLVHHEYFVKKCSNVDFIKTAFTSFFAMIEMVSDLSALEDMTLGRRKRKTESLLVVKGDEHQDLGLNGGLIEYFRQSHGSGADPMRRPTISRIEDSGRWEIELDQNSEEVRGVRIYIPNTFSPSRAFYPLPVHLDTAQVQKIVMRWLNQMMDVHYTLSSLERLYIRRGYNDLSESAKNSLSRLVGVYHQIWLMLSEKKHGLLQSSGLQILNGDVPKIGFTHSIDFVAALSTPEDRSLIRALVSLDQLIALYDRAYLTVDLSQMDYMDGTEGAYRETERMLSENMKMARSEIKEWLAAVDDMHH